MSLNKCMIEIFGAREWLLTDKCGGYALGTCDNKERRRYHSQLTIAALPPIRRVSVIGGIQECINIDNEEYILFNADEGELDFGRTEYQGNDAVTWKHTIIKDEHKIIAHKTLSLLPGGGAAIEYSISASSSSSSPVSSSKNFSTFLIRPILYQRCHHRTLGLDAFPHLTEIPSSRDNRKWEMQTSLLNFETINFNISGPNTTVREEKKTFVIDYDVEAQRGFESQETVETDFDFAFDISNKENTLINFAITMGKTDANNGSQKYLAQKLKELPRKENEKDKELMQFANELATAAEKFLVQGKTHKAIIAGYPWFGIWARDSLISLPGICFLKKDFSTAKSVLNLFAAHLEKGLIPNRFYMASERNSYAREYASADATMWYLYISACYVEASGDRDFVFETFQHLEQILEWHIKGTAHNIRVDAEDGLIYAGSHGVPLTWMHAHIGDKCFTARTGKPIEINALWIAGLKKWASIAKRSHRVSLAEKMENLAKKANNGFKKYWNNEMGWFADVLDMPTPSGYVPDWTLRPNQVIALALAEVDIPYEQRRRALTVVKEHLLLPVGLRGLSSKDPRYLANYMGSPEQRDMAYHNGPAWPWLLGSYISAQKIAFGKESMPHIREVIQNLKPFFGRDCFGQLAELYDSDYPYLSRGCPAQAASVAEMLRAIIVEYFELSSI